MRPPVPGIIQTEWLDSKSADDIADALADALEEVHRLQRRLDRRIRRNRGAGRHLQLARSILDRPSWSPDFSPPRQAGVAVLASLVEPGSSLGLPGRILRA